MNPVLDTLTRNQLFEKMFQRIQQAVYRVSVPQALTESQPLATEDLSNLTVREILDKLEDFLKSDPIDEHYSIFLRYLEKYPVSMCKRQISPVLKILIGFHYHLGQLYREDFKKVKPVSMEELAEVFGRSKASIHECIKETEESWMQFLEFRKQRKEAKAQAERELIEEEKTRLRKEKLGSRENTIQNGETSERTLSTVVGEVYSGEN